MRIPLFRIWYSTTYTTILLLLLIILAITPADMIYQSIKASKLRQLFVIGGVYLLTFFITVLIYSTRIYTNRTVLAAIPKSFIPVEDGEVGASVRRMVVKQLVRSAIVAWDCRPRDLGSEQAEVGGEDDERPGTSGSRNEKEKDRPQKKRGDYHGVQAIILPVSAKKPPWGHVSHPGWASPSSSDLSNLQYWKVLCELPNLIEAKAVSLAPPDPTLEDSGFQYPNNAPPLPDAHIVTLLQRPRAMGLRDYLARLSEFGLLNPPTLGPTFLAQYEYARFSTACLTELEFRTIMAVFADILNGMVDIEPSVIEEARAQSLASETRSLAPTASDSDTSSSHSRLPYGTPMLHRQPSTSSYTDSFTSTEDTPSPQTVHTAPSHQQRSPGLFNVPRTPSELSMRTQSDTGSVVIHSSVRRSPSTILPNSSTSSLRSAQSVIRLRMNRSEGELPYQYNIEGD
jgi:hypothetical protein